MLVCSHLASFNMSPVCLGPCVGIRRANALIDNTKQATGEGKKKNGLTRLAAMALLAEVHLTKFCTFVSVVHVLFL